MPNTYNSYHTVAEQIINYNDNVVQILQQINSLMTTAQSTLSLSITDSSGNLTSINVPSFNSLQSQIKTLSNNINTIYGLNNNGATIQTGPNSFQRIITVDLNLEPEDITQITLPKTFVSQRNYMFDTLMDPELFLKVDLTSKIDTDTREILYRRYVINFEIDSSGAYTNLGNSALNSFNSIFSGQSNIVLKDFLTWQATTPGVLQPGDAEFSQNTVALNPNQLQYDGLFTVLYSEIDANNILWYYVNSINYTEILTGNIYQLAIGDSLIINIKNSSTIYQIINISNSSSNPKLQLVAVTGNQPIPVGITNGLKYYSTILINQTVNIPIGFNEYCVIFTKALNTTNNISSKNWSYGLGLWTNNLNLDSFDNYNGVSMTQYYNSVVNDYGAALKELVHKTVPVEQGITPNAPALNTNNFQVVQTNLHLTNTKSINSLKQQASQVAQLDSELNSISNAIAAKNKQIQISRYLSDADKQKAKNDLTTLQTQYTSVSNQKISINNQILASSNTNDTTPQYAVRGFWTIPAPAVPTYSYIGQANSGKPQQIVKFDVQYKRLSKDGTETPIVLYSLYDSYNGISATKNNKTNTAVFANWENYATISLERVYDTSTKTFNWVLPDQNDANQININQLNIPIHPNETIQIRIRSISEVGFPDSPLYSEWSNSINISFPDSLINSTNNTTSIIEDARMQSAKDAVLDTLNTQGLNGLLSQQTTVNNTTYFLSSESILSGFKNTNGQAIDLYDYLKTLTDTIAALQASIDKSQGKLLVKIFKNNTSHVVNRNAIINFAVNCEDYCTKYVDPGVPSGRVYANNIYTVKDYFIEITNSQTNSSLSLTSNITYTSGSTTAVFNNSAPQVFWVDDKDELTTSDTSGASKTQLDNQFFWSVNYDSINQTTVTPLASNIGNAFTSNNSITNVLSNSEYNLGYSENSILSFIGNNKSLMDTTKWIDITPSVSSQNKLLSTIHPSVIQLTDLVETNTQQIHYLTTLNPINIPINIYFKLNALDNTQVGANYQYVNLNGVTQNVRHVKELKFYLALQGESSPFQFTVKFTLNRITS